MPRSRKIPHLEYRKSGYVWRRRLPRSLTQPSQAYSCLKNKIDSDKPLFKTSRTADVPIGENPYASAPIWTARNTKSSKTRRRDFEDHGGFHSLVFSLKTHSYPAAQELATRLTALSNLTFHYISSSMALTPSVITHVLTTLARFEIEAADRIRVLDDQRTPEAAEFALRRERAMQDTLRRTSKKFYEINADRYRRTQALAGLSEIEKSLTG